MCKCKEIFAAFFQKQILHNSRRHHNNIIYLYINNGFEKFPIANILQDKSATIYIYSTVDKVYDVLYLLFSLIKKLYFAHLHNYTGGELYQILFKSSRLINKKTKVTRKQ